jgi:hypothetical protein
LNANETSSNASKVNPKQAGTNQLRLLLAGEDASALDPAGNANRRKSMANSFADW